MGREELSHVVLFDGICNLCERSVQLVIRNDRARLFRFASLQSDAAEALLTERDSGDAAEPLSSVILIENDRVYRRSRAALRIARHMDGAWPLLFYGFYWIPALIADRVYDFIGNRRYRWFGKKEACWVPNEDLAERFIDTVATSPLGNGASS
ncbi:MAG: DCC1-like thiol-disulfide oxidoreductase family protein [Pseudomonadota bacterium]